MRRHRGLLIWGVMKKISWRIDVSSGCWRAGCLCHRISKPKMGRWEIIEASFPRSEAGSVVTINSVNLLKESRKFSQKLLAGFWWIQRRGSRGNIWLVVLLKLQGNVGAHSQSEPHATWGSKENQSGMKGWSPHYREEQEYVTPAKQNKNSLCTLHSNFQETKMRLSGSLQ